MNLWLKERKDDIAIKFILFLISPLFAFIFSVRRLNTKSSYIIFFLTAVFFGLAFSVDIERESINLDGAYYRLLFESYVNTTTLEFKNDFIQYLAFENNIPDFFTDTLAFYVSRFTDNYHIFFAFATIFFSYFSLKSLRFLTSEEKFNNSLYSLILVYLFLYNQIFNINGLRFWTAAWLAIYCIFQIFRNDNKKYFFLALLTPFIHGSYFLFIIILILGLIVRKYDKLWSFLFFLSFLFSSFALEFIDYFAQKFGELLPRFMASLINSYTSEENLNQTWSGLGWIPLSFKYIVNFYLAYTMLLFIRHSTEIKLNAKTKDLYQFLLIWVTIFNFLIVVPSLGNRFLTLSYPLIAYIWLVIFKDKKYRAHLLLLPIVFFWEILVQLLLYARVLDVFFIFSSPFLLIYKYIITY